MKRSVTIKKKRSLVYASLVTLFLVILVLLAIMKEDNIIPFGENSFATTDAKIQYLNFFSYYKDVLNGKNSIFYTLSSGLGMSGVGTFAYYLASPLNYLIIFFSKNDLNTFFSLIVVLKVALAGFFMSIFLSTRFQYRLKPIFNIILSLGYALMQYNFAQCSNIMWLDGVYMLPLILLGTYYAVARKKTLFFSIAVSLSILFQWYSAGINCLYSIAWFLMELLLLQTEKTFSKKEILERVLKYVWSILIGVMVSMILFWPNVMALRQGKGHFDWKFLKPNFRGNVIQSILRFSIGSTSSSNAAALFCGGFVILGIIGFFTCTFVKKKVKCIIGIMAGFSILIFYWQPLFFLYSLLKDASSYWFRYSYVSIFFLIYVAALYFCNWEKEDRPENLIKCIFAFSFLLLILKFADNENNLNFIYYTILFVFFEALLLTGLKKYWKSQQIRKILSIGLVIVVLMELFENGKILVNVYKDQDVSSYKQYTAAEETQIDAIQNADRGIYRINQTSTWNEGENNITSNYNESMAYGYNGIASYTSSPQMSQLEFLNNLGYRMEGNCISVVNASILPVDSLLGVKYVLSNMKIPGYTKINNVPISYDGKEAFKNPYALPMAFIYKNKKTNMGEKEASFKENPFEYVNGIYSELLGHKVDIFEPLDYQTKRDDNGEVHYYVHGVNSNWPVYGNILCDMDTNILIDVNGSYKQGYARWLSPSVFYIPISGLETYLTLTSPNQMNELKPQFYICNLEKLEKAVTDISRREAKFFYFQNGSIKVSTKSYGKDNSMILLIPYNSGWSVRINGKKSEIKSFRNGLIKVPLQEGNNSVEFHYSIPGLKMGIAGSLAGIFLLFFTEFFSKRRKRKENN